MAPKSRKHAGVLNSGKEQEQLHHKWGFFCLPDMSTPLREEPLHLAWWLREGVQYPLYIQFIFSPYFMSPNIFCLHCSVLKSILKEKFNFTRIYGLNSGLSKRLQCRRTGRIVKHGFFCRWYPSISYCELMILHHFHKKASSEGLLWVTQHLMTP